MGPFHVARPATADEARELLAANEQATPYAGGTELLLAMKAGFLDYDCLVDVKAVPGFGELTVDDGIVHIGATVTHRTVERSPAVAAALPILADVEAHVGNVRVRNSGTIGGNLCFAEPHSDVAALALLLDARAVVAGAERRVEPIDELVVDAYTTTLDPTELLERIEIPVPPPTGGVGYSRFKFNERPLAVAGARIEASGEVVEQATIVVGSIEPLARRYPGAAAALVGQPVGDLAAGREAAHRVAVEVDVIEDQDGSERYKRHLAGVLVMRACASAAGRLRASRTAA